MKILYADSERAFAKKCLNYLIDQKYDIKYVHSVQDAFTECTYNMPDLLIFDHILDDGSGFYLVKQLYKSNIECKTILFSSNISEQVMADAIKLGIDRFVSKKQTTYIALNDQIKELYKNSVPHDTKRLDVTDVYNFGNDFLYKPGSFTIFHHSEKIPLTNQEKKLIDLLLDAKGEYLSSEQLQSSIGKDEYTSIDTLRTVIKKVRQKTYSNIIQNKSGYGYKIHLKKKVDMNVIVPICDKSFSSLKVLVVLGKKEVSDKVSRMLDDCGFNCENTYTLDKAKEFLEHFSFDYIITSLDLPDGDGLDLVQAFSEGNKKFIVISEVSEVHYKEYLYFQGILNYMTNNGRVDYLVHSICEEIKSVEKNRENSRVLVVEKSKKIFEQIQALLSPRNYQLVLMSDLGNVKNSIEKEEYALLILSQDIDRTFAFVRCIKSTVNTSLPILILSDMQRNYDDVREAYMSGANECLRKPVFPEEFILKVDQLVKHNRVVRELEEKKNRFEKYQMIVDESSCFFKTDLTGTITYVNEKFCKTSGYTSEELIGKDHSIIRHPHTPQSLYDEMWRIVKDKKNTWEGILDNRKKNGEYCTAKTYMKPVLDNDGNVKEFISLQIDMKEIKPHNTNSF